MRATRIYHPERLNLGAHLKLDDLAAHHIIAVLRFKLGDEFTLFDGQNHEYHVRIAHLHKKQVEVVVLEVHEICRESTLKIHLAQGIAKGERWTYSLQKAVELGVDEITPLWTQHVAYKWDKKVDEKKLDQWRAIIISACEQSGRTQIPKLNTMCSFEEFIQAAHPKNRVILHPGENTGWRQMTWHPSSDCTVLVGPEGGFSAGEYGQAMQQQFQSLTLGPRVLRTETAVVSALSLLQALHGDL